MELKSFKGLNNIQDPMRMELGWLTTADNVDVTSTGGVQRRSGYALAMAGAFSSAYATLDTQRLYLVDGNELKVKLGAATGTISALTSTDTMYWCEVNGDVYFNNGTDCGVISKAHELITWRGRSTQDVEFLDAAGEPQSALLNPLPFGVDVIQHWRGRIYAAQYMPDHGQTVLWFSQPLGYHLFRLDTDFIVLPGRITMLAPHDSALLIGTDRHVYAYSDKLDELAPYGVIPGQHWAESAKRIYFWTQRGLCSALPFTNHTEAHVSVAPGARAGGIVLEDGGQRRYVVVLQQGGDAHNKH